VQKPSRIDWKKFWRKTQSSQVGALQPAKVGNGWAFPSLPRIPTSLEQLLKTIVAYSGLRKS